MKRPWTHKDSTELIRLARTRTGMEIAKIMGRAYCTVCRNANRLNVRMKKQKPTARMTDKQIDFIMSSYPALSFGEISRRLNKPLSSVTWRYKKEKEKEAKREAAKKEREILSLDLAEKAWKEEGRRFPLSGWGYRGWLRVM